MSGSSVSMRPNLRPADVAAEGPQEATAAQAFSAAVRDTLASRLARYSERWPDVLDVLADVHVALHDELHGGASALCGALSPAHFRETLRGERDLSVKDLLRIMSSAHPRARAAGDRVLSILTGMRDSAIAMEHSEAHAQLGEAFGRLSAEGSRALRDGRIDASEAAALEPEIADMEAALARLKATAARAKAGLR